MKKKIYTSIADVIADTEKGITVYWQNELYKVMNFNGRYIVFCESTSFSGGFIDLNDPTEYYSIN